MLLFVTWPIFLAMLILRMLIQILVWAAIIIAQAAIMLWNMCHKPKVAHG